MSLLFRGVLWFGLYLVVVLLPLGVGLLATPGGHHAGPWSGAASGLGLAAFSVIVIEFALVSRLHAASEPFGTDALMQFHRLMGLGGLAAVVVHAAWFAFAAGSVNVLNPLDPASPVRAGAAAAWLLLAMVTASVHRRKLGISYEAWQLTHSIGAMLVVVASFAHLARHGSFSSAPALRALLVAYVVALLLLMAWYRLWRPWNLRRHPWEVEYNRDVGGSTRALGLRPLGHRGFGFLPGQFAWLSTARSPFALAQHPISLSSSAVTTEPPLIEFAIKALGNWSASKVPSLSPGERVWVDGPYGAFSIDREPGTGLVLISGGSGVAPMLSMLRTMRDRGDPRPVVHIHGARSPERMALRDELEALAGQLNLRFVPVYEDPPEGWTGERGFVDAVMLARYLPARPQDYQYFVCGPGGMMDVVESALAASGIPPERIHTERFDMV